MVDHNATTEDPMTTEAEPAVGVATVLPPDKPSPAPELPPLAVLPLICAPVDEVLRWVGRLSIMTGSPDEVYVSVTTRKIDISTSNQRLFVRWQTIIGAIPQPARYDALGTVISATRENPGLWSVTIRAHVGTTLGAMS